MTTAAPAVSVGQQLPAARLAKSLSADDVAKALKLSLRQVESIEGDDWQSLPGNTIIRGFRAQLRVCSAWMRIS